MTKGHLHDRVANRVYAAMARIIDRRGRTTICDLDEHSAIRSILMALRSPPANMFAACGSVAWLQREAWQRCVDAALAELPANVAKDSRSDLDTDAVAAQGMIKGPWGR